MKKIISLLLLILMPIIVKAEDLDLSQYEYKEFEQGFSNTAHDQFLSGGGLYVSNSYTYDGEKYHLTGNVEYQSPLIYYIYHNESDYLFVCHSSSPECYVLYVVLPKLEYISGTPNYHNFMISGGTMFDESMINIYFGEDYETMDNGHYKLKNPIEDNRWDRHNRDDKYICKKIHMHEDCEDVGRILFTHDGLSFGVDWVSARILIGDSIVFKNDKYYLQNIQTINPAYAVLNREGNQTIYTCFTKDDNCEDPVRIIYSAGPPLDDGSGFYPPTKVYYEVLGTTEESLTIKLDETGTIKDVDDSDTITIADPDLIEITIKDGNGIVTPKKDGSTDITIVTSTHQTRLIHLTINPLEKEEAPKEQKNPNTNNETFIPIILFIASAIVYFICKTKVIEREI